MPQSQNAHQMPIRKSAVIQFQIQISEAQVLGWEFNIHKCCLQRFLESVSKFNVLRTNELEYFFSGIVSKKKKKNKIIFHFKLFLIIIPFMIIILKVGGMDHLQQSFCESLEINIF